MPPRLTGAAAQQFAASLDAFIDETVVSEMEQVPPPTTTKAGKPLPKRARHLKGVQALAASPGYAPRRELTGEALMAGASAALPSAWARQHRRLKGQPLLFVPLVITDRTLNKVRPFLLQPLNDEAIEKGYRKARQIGLSENSVTELLWFTDVHEHVKAFYTFPTAGAMRDFSNTRIAEAIQESPHLQARIGEVDNVNLKKVGTSFIFLRGAQAERMGESVDADAAYFDEIDRMPPSVKSAFEESLSASNHGLVREISTPTVPNYGIDIGWNKSKQWEWFIRCDHCRTPQTLAWLPNDDFNGRVSVALRDSLYQYVCRHCEKILAPEARFAGEWVARYPSRAPSFYQFSQMMAPWITAQKLFDKQEDYPFKQLFHNYCLGIPYLGDNILVTEKQILDARGTVSHTTWKGPRVFGIDWGDVSWIVCLQLLENNKIGLVHLERIDTGDLPQIIQAVLKARQKFQPDLLVNDSGYGKDRNSTLLKLFPDRVFSCFYPNVEADTKITEPVWQDSQHKVSVDRTTTLKLHLGLFRDQRMIIAREVDPVEVARFVKHCTNLVSVKDMDEKTMQVSEWIANTGHDHYGHAFNYACIGLGKLGDLPTSECWDWAAEVQEEKRRNLLTDDAKGTPERPRVPGMMSMQELAQSSGGMAFVRPDKAACYSLKYGYDVAVCDTCSLQRSCKKICEANKAVE